ncbi:MAG: hypothetical protein Kow006_15430 [Gammaproteobacteria bacterium]
MPYVRRDHRGRIEAVFRTATDGFAEWLPEGDEELESFLGAERTEASFGRLDADFIRVIEDLIDTLIAKGVLRLTDLPHEAQRKLLARKSLRGRLRNDPPLLDNDEVI